GFPPSSASCAVQFRSAHSPPKLGGVPSRSKGGAVCSKPARSALLTISAKRTRLIRSASRTSIRWLRGFEQTTPDASRRPLLTKEGNRAKPHLNNINIYETRTGAPGSPPDRAV